MTCDELPKQFLASVRVIFDVLDSEKQSFIYLRDIEGKWNRENTEKLPKGNNGACVASCIFM